MRRARSGHVGASDASEQDYVKQVAPRVRAFTEGDKEAARNGGARWRHAGISESNGGEVEHTSGNMTEVVDRRRR